MRSKVARLKHKSGDESTVTIGYHKKDDYSASTKVSPHLNKLITKSKVKISNDRLSICCSRHLEGISKLVCHNLNTEEPTKYTCIMELCQDEDITSAAETLPRSYLRRNDYLKKKVSS